MGCWNGTCFISNLPIRHGEPIVGFTIEYAHWSSDLDYSGSCYPEAFARPIGLPLYGEYNDYGRIEKVEANVAQEYLLHLFNAKDSDVLLADIERDNIKRVSNITKKEVGVGLVMVHRDIFNKLIKSFVPNSNTISILKIADGLKQLREIKNERGPLKNAPGFSKKDYELYKEMCMGINIERIMGLRFDILEQKDYTDMIKFVLSLSRKHDKKIAKEFAELLYCDRVMRMKMHELRKLWIGPSGKGSQSEKYKTHLLLANATRDHILKAVCEDSDNMRKAYNFFLGDEDY